jgi:hypothetical protein
MMPMLYLSRIIHAHERKSTILQIDANLLLICMHKYTHTTAHAQDHA